jgi:hypothetical protein
VAHLYSVSFSPRRSRFDPRFRLHIYSDMPFVSSRFIVLPVTHFILWQIDLSSRYPDQRSWKNVGKTNTHKKKKSKDKTNKIQSPEKDLLLITSWFPFSVPSTSKVHPMGRDRDRYRILAKRTLARRKRRPRNVNLGICYFPSTSQTSHSDVFETSLGLQCAIWGNSWMMTSKLLRNAGKTDVLIASSARSRKSKTGTVAPGHLWRANHSFSVCEKIGRDCWLPFEHGALGEHCWPKCVLSYSSHFAHSKISGRSRL